jgi:hypothetical protein
VRKYEQFWERRENTETKQKEKHEGKVKLSNKTASLSPKGVAQPKPKGRGPA